MRFSALTIKKKYRPIVTVFGSSTGTKDSSLYELAEKTGQIIASHGYTVASGGYTGTMDAVSKGAFQKGGNVLGITTDEITKARVSNYLTEEIREESLMSRLELLLKIGSISIFLPGSTGTLTELSLTWDKQKLGLISITPILLMAEQWSHIFGLLFKQSNVPLSPWKKDLEVMKNTFVIKNVKELNKWFSNRKANRKTSL